MSAAGSSPPARAAGADQQTNGAQTNGADTPATVISDAAHWLLTSLQLTSVQPACLPRPADPAAPVQHSLLLHLEAGLERRGWPEHSSSTAQPSAAESEAGAGTVVTALDPPLPLPSAVLEVVVLAHNVQLLLQRQASLAQLVQQQQQQDAPSADVTSGCRSVCINISISFPAQPSQSSMDAVHLLLTVHEQSIAAIAAAADGARSSGSSSSSRLAVLVAEVPILLMSAAAQQEVQQLLLPAMRQDVQAGMADQQQQQQQQQLAQATDDQLSREIMRVESTVLEHFCQLAQDMLVVVQLSAQAHAAAAAAAAGGLAAADAASEVAGASTPVAVAAAAAAQQYSTSTAVVEASPGAAVQTPPAVALQHLSENLVLPLLLPFLAAHRLYNVLQLLLDCLPLQLQQRWQQQQSERQRTLALAAADSAVERQHQQPLVLNAASRQLASTPEGGAAKAAAAGDDTGSLHAADAAHASAQQCAGAQLQEAAASDACSRGSRNPSAKACRDAAAGGVAAAASWPVPLSGFADADEEQRYAAWKHASLLHLDWLSAVFDAFYLLALVKRLLREPTTIFYLLFIVIKTLPHVLLVLGHHQAFLRHRELWLFLIGPATALLTWLAAATSIYVLKQPPLLLTASAFKAFWQGRGELATSTMRPFMQHIAQTYGFAAAASRWGPAAVWSVALCWALDLHMRRLFVAQQGRQAARQALHGSPVHGGGPAAASGAAVNSQRKQA